jgi:hypothetical protein
MIRSLVLAVLFLAAPAFAQTLLPARQSSVATNTFEVLLPATPTVQGTLEWIDDHYFDGTVDDTSWNFLNPTSANVQSTFNFLDTWFFSMGASNGLMRGTNIIGATFNAGQWTVDGTGTNYVNLLWTNSFRAVKTDQLDSPSMTNFGVGVGIAITGFTGNVTTGALAAGFNANSGVFTPGVPGRYLIFAEVWGQNVNTTQLAVVYSAIDINGQSQTALSAYDVFYPYHTNAPVLGLNRSFHMGMSGFYDLYGATNYASLSVYSAYGPFSSTSVVINGATFGAALLYPFHQNFEGGIKW